MRREQERRGSLGGHEKLQDPDSSLQPISGQVIKSADGTGVTFIASSSYIGLFYCLCIDCYSLIERF